MSFAKRAMREAVVGHQEKNAGGGRDTSECAGKHAYEYADIDEQAEDGDATDLSECAHRGLAGAQVLPGAAQAEHLGVGARGEDRAREQGALNDGARNCFKRMAGCGPEGGGAFESHKAEERENRTEPQAAAAHAAQLDLRPVQVPTVSEEDEHHHDEDERNGYGFDPQHEASGNLDVAPGNPDGDCGYEEGKEGGGDAVASGVAQ